MSNSRQIASLPNILTLIDDAGGQFIKQQAAATTTSYTITWPAAVGGSGRLLGTTDGSGTLGWLNSVSVAVSGGTVDNSIIGGSTPAAITGTTIVANSGFTGALTGNATTATALATGRTFSFTGDATGTSGAFTGAANASTALTLAASGVNAGSYGSATAIPVLTIDAKGRITSASTASISSSLTIAADSGSNDTVGVGTDTLTFAGTSNEIETTVSNNQIQIGLPSTVSGLTTVNATNLQGALAGTIASTTTAVTQAASDNTTKVATTAYVNTALANLVDSAPAALDTLNELAAAMGDDANFSTTVTNSIATKLALAGGTMTGNLDLNDNVKIRVGTGQDLEIYHDPSLSINNIISPSGSILFGVQTSGSFTYKLGSTQKFQIASGAVVIADALRTPIVTGNSLYGIDFQQQALLPYSTNQTIDNTVDLGSSSKQFRNIYGVNIYADTGITGTLLTAAQTNITSVGTLGSLNVSGTVTANAFSGTVTGNITGNVTGNVSGSAATVTGAAQSAITSVGTLTSLAVSGDVTVDTSVFKVDTSNNRVGILNASPDVTLDIGSATDSIHIPVGTTAQRPGSPAAGYFRYNSSLSQFEGYTSAWGAIGGGGTNTFNHNVFTGDGSTTAFALAAATESENNLLVFIDGVFQEQGAYSIATSSGTTTLTMSAAPASGRKLVVYQVSAGVSGSNLNIDTMTGDGSDTTLTLSIAPVNENNTQVFFDGVYQNKSTYSISGTTLTFSTAPPTGVAVEVMTFTQTEVNVPVNDTVDTVHLKAGAVTAAKIESSLDLSSKSLTLPAVAVPSASTATTQSASDNTTKIATTAYVTTAIANLIDGAPGTLNTLNELAAALADDAAFSSTITTSLAAKANLAAPNFTGNVTFDTTTLTVDATNNRVGIGTASPNRQLSLYHASQAEVGFKTGSVSNGALIYYNDTENKLLLRAQETSDHIEFQTGGTTERMRIDSSGNVGIGESNPLDSLSISSSAGNAAIRLKRTDTTIANDDIYGAINFAGDDSDTNASGIRGFIRGRAQGTGGGMKMEFHTAGGGAALVSEPRMTLNADGNLGIGHTSPAYGLAIHKEGDHLQLTTNASGEAAGNGTDLKVDASSSDFQLLNYESANITLWTAGAERMRIDSSGNLLVGKTNTTFSSNGIELRGSNGGARFIRANAEPILMNRTGSDGKVLGIYKDGAEVGSIGTVDGAPYYAGTAKALRIGTAGFYPATNTGAYSDGTVDLGYASGRFKDLYTMTVQASTGTASAPAYSFAADTNSGMYLNSADTLCFSTAGSEAMRIDSNGNVGIGRTPNAPLDIQGSSTGTLSALRIRNSGQAAGSEVKMIFSLNRDGSDVDFEAAGITVGKVQNWTTAASTIDSFMAFRLVENETVSEKMRIDNSGNVIIGDTASAQGGILSITKASGSTPITLLSRSGTASHQGQLLFQQTTSTSGGYTATGSARQLGLIGFRGVDSAGVAREGAGIYAEQSGSAVSGKINGELYFRTADAVRERIGYNGRYFFYGMDSSSTYGSWAFGHSADGSSNGYLSSWTNVFGHRIHLRTNGNANPSENGTVSFSGSGSNNFRIMQNVGYNGVYWNSSTQTGRGTTYEMDNGSHYWSSTDSVASGSQYSPATRMWLDTAGNLRTSGSMTANYSFSDQRLKQDVEELPSALDKVKALRTVKFNWIDEEQRREHKELGLIAQEVKEIYPELVHTNEMFPAEDEDTLEKIKGEERYSMEYEKLSVVLLKAMQEQQTLIETLQAEVAALKGE